MKRAHHPLEKSVEYLITEFDKSGLPTTTKLPEQWLTIREVERNTDNMAEIYSIEGKKLTGGKTPDSGNWLAKMKVGTIFVCELNVDAGLQTIIQQEYEVTRKDGDSIMLTSNLNEPEVHARVNPERFCKYYNLVTINFEPEEEQPNADY